MYQFTSEWQSDMWTLRIEDRFKYILIFKFQFYVTGVEKQLKDRLAHIGDYVNWDVSKSIILFILVE